MTEEKADYVNDDFYVDDDFKEERRRWEGIHNDEAAQYRLPFEGAILKDRNGEDMSPAGWLFCSLGCLGGTAVLCFGLYKLILFLF